MTNDEKFAADLSAITGRRIDPPKVEEDEFSTDADLSDPGRRRAYLRGDGLRGAERRAQALIREEKHLKDSINALENLLDAYADDQRPYYDAKYDRARRAHIEARDEWNRLQPLLALPRLEDDQ